MAHWGWYWKYKKQHIPKGLCSWESWNTIDSFEIFNRNSQGLGWVRNSENKLLFEIFNPYKIKVSLLENNSLKIEHDLGSYVISVERKSCNYGGNYYFFYCPKCSRRMRKLYCLKSFYLCRKCLKLGYYTQRLSTSRRNSYMSRQIEKDLKQKGGSLYEKPPRMHQSIFNRLQVKSREYDYKSELAMHEELWRWFGDRL